MVGLYWESFMTVFRFINGTGNMALNTEVISPIQHELQIKYKTDYKSRKSRLSHQNLSIGDIYKKKLCFSKSI